MKNCNNINFLRRVKADFAEAERVKAEIFEKAWKNFQHGKGDRLQHEFKDFCKKESYWLDDFTLYMLLKQQNDCQPWFQWPDEFKLREKHALQKLLSGNKEHIEKIQWLQFLFARQWHELKKLLQWHRELNFLETCLFM
ncbi:MAG: 4-alpha-glucanotransferase [Segetibacter sp.]